jgi:hypothetical protein
MSDLKSVPDGTGLSDDGVGKLIPGQKIKVPYILLLQYLQGETELEGT